VIDRGAWLEARRKGLGGSDAAAILGLSRYRSAVDVWEDKLGLVAERPQTPAMAWGLRLEDAISTAFVETTGIRVRKVPGIRRAKHVRSFPMIGSLDRLAEDGTVVELKKKRTDTDLSESGPPEKRVPPDWYVQGQHYAEIVDAPTIRYAVLVGGTDFRVIEVPRDRDFGADLVEEERKFWTEYVETGQQPPVGPDDLAYLSRKYPVSLDEEIVATSEVRTLVDAYLAAVDEVERWEGLRDGYRASIEDFMGTAAKLVSGVASVSWKAYERTDTKWKAVAEAYRDALEAIARAEARELELGGKTFISDEIAPDLDAILEANRTVSTVRPFRVDRKKED
jgi:putative phage-type endonuclease